MPIQPFAVLFLLPGQAAISSHTTVADSPASAMAHVGQSLVDQGQPDADLIGVLSAEGVRLLDQQLAQLRQAIDQDPILSKVS